MSVANFPYKQVRYFTASEGVPSVLAGGVAANTAADAVSAPLIVNLTAPFAESVVTLSPGSYILVAETFVTIAAAQTACQKMELCLHEVILGVTQPNPYIIGPTYTGAALVGAGLAMPLVQIQLQLRSSSFVMAATRSWAIRINYNGMPNAAASAATFSTLAFIKTSDETSISQLSFKT